MTAFTGQSGLAGASQLGLLQMGGPVYAQSYDRTLPASARPLLGHAYGNDGVTPVTTFSPLNRPTLTATTANGGFNQILLNLAAPLSNVVQGNIVRLSEQGGDGSFIYSGIVEDIPDSIRPDGVDHQLLLSPPAYELDDTYTQLNYTAPVDIAQMARDAIALTLHLSCDQTSVPAFTGILAATTGALDFRNQSAKQVLDTARSIAGPTWFWYVDELFRVWLQPMGSGAVYTIPRSQYEERTKAASIQNRKNRVDVVGGVPVGGSLNLKATVNDTVSQALIGIRALHPPINLPHITEQASISAIASNVLTVLNRIWNRVHLKLVPTYARRIHGSWPGGAMIRYWEPGKSPLQESAQGIGNYSNAFIAQSVENDGLYQKVVAGDIPVTSQTDIQNMVNGLVARGTAVSFQITPQALNRSQQVMTGSVVSGTATVNGAPSAQWQLTPTEFEAIDTAAVVRAEMGNLAANGVSPAQWGFRASDASGVPIFDSLGLIKAATLIGSGGVNWTLTTVTGVGGAAGISGVGGEVTLSTASFSLTRTSSVLLMAVCSAYKVTTAGAIGLYAPIYIRVTGQANSAAGSVSVSTTLNVVTWPASATPFQVLSLPAGSYTANLIWNSIDGVNCTLTYYTNLIYVFLLGS